MPDDLVKDVRLAFRGLIRRPGAALVAIVALALGIGLTAAMFSIVNGVILKGLPVEDSDRLLAVNRMNPSQGQSRLLTRIHDYADLSERQTTFEGLSAYEVSAFNLGLGEGPPDLVQGANVTTNTFELLRTAPFLGRGFASEDGVVGARPVALIAHRFWQERLGGDPDVVGTDRPVGRPAYRDRRRHARGLRVPVQSADLEAARGRRPLHRARVRAVTPGIRSALGRRFASAGTGRPRADHGSARHRVPREQ